MHTRHMRPPDCSGVHMIGSIFLWWFSLGVLVCRKGSGNSTAVGTHSRRSGHSKREKDRKREDNWGGIPATLLRPLPLSPLWLPYYCPCHDPCSLLGLQVNAMTSCMPLDNNWTDVSGRVRHDLRRRQKALDTIRYLLRSKAILCETQQLWGHWQVRASPVNWCGVVWCGVVWCGVPKALLPEGNGRDVYPRVQVNGRAVCVARAPCVGVWLSAERGGVGETWMSPS